MNEKTTKLLLDCCNDIRFQLNHESSTGAAYSAGMIHQILRSYYDANFEDEDEE